MKTPFELWEQAGKETKGMPNQEAKRGERYLELMRAEGHLMYPGDPGYEDGVKLRCDREQDEEK